MIRPRINAKESGDQLDQSAIGKRIRARRRQLDITQAALAKTLGVSDVYISFLESGKSLASLRLLITLARVLDVSLDHLVFGNGEGQSATE